MNKPQFPVPPPDLQPYLMEVADIGLFPEVAQPMVIEEIAGVYGYTAERVRQEFDSLRDVIDYHRNCWARVIEPSTQKSFHEMAPIVARVRLGAATFRESAYLGSFAVAAITHGDEHNLNELARLACAPIAKAAWYRAFLAYRDFFKINKRFPRSMELKSFIEEATNTTRYDSVDTGNWSRVVRLSGLSVVFDLAKKGE